MKTCPICNSEFEQGLGRTKAKKYCSAKCLSADAYQREIARRQKKCIVCGKPGVRSDATTCSKTCFAAYRLTLKPKDLVLYVPRSHGRRKSSAPKILKPRRFVSGRCLHCGGYFTAIVIGKAPRPPIYCSTRCGHWRR